MRKYEITYILRHNADIDVLKLKIKKIIEKNNGSIIEENDWGVKDFAYEINKQKKGFYSVMICNTSSENIDELLHNVRINNDIIRVMVINTEKEKHYIQSTKLSKTEVGTDKIEHKTIGKKYRKKTFDIKVPEGKTTTEKPYDYKSEFKSENKKDYKDIDEK